MAINVAGFDGSPVTEASWARLMALAAGQGAIVDSGLTVTPGAGTRVLSVAPGTALIGGLLVEITAAETATVAAKTTTGPRLDWLVLDANWSANTVQVAVVQGGTSLPALIQDLGSRYQMPLAAITVRQNVTTVAAADIAERAPLRREPNYLSTGQVSTGDVVASSSGVNLLDLSVPDPGWPYRLHVEGAMRIRRTIGTGTGYVTVRGQVAGSTFVQASSSDIADAPLQMSIAGVSGVRTGSTTFQLVTVPLSITANTAYDVNAANSYVTVTQLPA